MSEAPLCVVGIGASAGGIEAFRQFFNAMPHDSGLAFVVVLHLAAGHESMLPSILGRWTKMPVAAASDGDTVVANRVFVAPAGTMPRLREGRLALNQITADAPRAMAPIDALFDSLAEDLNEDAIGVILSGTGHDGALGLKAIKSRGGLTLAQGPNGSGPEYPGMPDSAVAAGAVDLHVPVDAMPGHIIAARRLRLTSLRDPDGSAGIEKIRADICNILRSRLGHDFSQYKAPTFMRRVQRRMQVLRLAGYDEYIARLEAEREEVVLLFRDLLISVTRFFRDLSTFSVVEKDIVPSLFQGKDATSELRIWVPGCATGEEAYSLAMLLREHMDTLSVTPKVQIFASDIDNVAIGTARAGRFPATLLEGMSAERRSRHFTEGPGGYSVKQEVRELCTFSAHSLIRDPPFSRIDLISCRNLLIYMDNNLQDRVIPVFHYALRPNGILILGSSETVTRHERLFQPLDRSQRIFVRVDGPSDLPTVYNFVAGSPRQVARAGASSRPEPNVHWPKAIAFAHRRILDRFASPFVVVNAAGEVAHFSSHTGRFLEPAKGSPTANIFELARRGWELDIRSALRRCVETGRLVEHLRPTEAADGENPSAVKLVVEPLPSPDNDPLFMVVFAAAGSPDPTDSALQRAPQTDPAVAHLERENHDLREQLQSVVEEHATTVEELRSSNEELQSVNEELQSSNEELETSREEIQSINEELHTVNSQLSNKVEELDRTNGDLKNLFESTKVATVFLDPFMVIRSFTPDIATIYNLIPSDIGRPLSDIVSSLTYSTLREDMKTVLQTLQPMERRVERADRSAHYLMRILPYRTPDSRFDGSLITFVDVTTIVRAEEHQRLLVDELNHRVKNMLTVVISLATSTLRRAETLDAFQEVFLGRIHALTAAYALLSREGWSQIALRELVTEQLRPFLSGEQPNIQLSGPPVWLLPRAALALGMAVHELSTNAVKYGALSSAAGNVTVTWSVSSGDRLIVTWIERNGPPVTPPAQQGFGLTLIERGFAHDVHGDVKVEFRPEGVVAVLSAPLSGKAYEGPK